MACLALTFGAGRVAASNAQYTGFLPTQATTNTAPTCSVKVRDQAGLKQASGMFQYSVDGGISWLPRFFDDFGTGANQGWSPVGGGSWAPADQDGDKRAKGSLFFGSSQSLVISIPTLEYADCRINCKAYSAGLVGPQFGLVFRYQDPQNFYTVLFRHIDDTVTVLKTAGGITTTLRTQQNVTLSSETWYQVKLEVAGPVFHIFLDGQQLLEVTDETLLYGAAGMTVREEPLNTFARDAFFDDFTVDDAYLRVDNQTGQDGSQGQETLSAAQVPFNQYSLFANQIRFRVSDVNWVASRSQAYTVPIVRDDGTPTPTTPGSPSPTPTGTLTGTPPTPSPTQEGTATPTPTSVFTATPVPTATPSLPPGVPPAPVIDLEPKYSRGLSNAISWGEVPNGAAFLAQCSDDLFLSIRDQSGWIPDRYFQFRNLQNGTQYFYRVRARNSEGTEGPWSNIVESFQDNESPILAAAGYMDTALTTQGGGTLTLAAAVLDFPVEDNIANVEIYVDGIPSGVSLRDDGTYGDAVSGDQLFTLSLPVGAGVPEGRYLLALIAEDGVGFASTLWPYFRIARGTASAPQPALPLHPVDPELWTTLHRKAIIRSAAGGPAVKLAGYLFSQITEEQGGTLDLIAWVTHPGGSAQVRAVELLYGQVGTGVYLTDDGLNGDFTAGDEVFTLHLGGVPPGAPAGDYLFELQATDFQGNRSGIWPYLNVTNPPPNTPPTVTILRPADGSAFAPGEVITFEGEGTDPEDGQLPDAAFSWESSLDGFLNTGRLITRTLSEGIHVITLTGSDRTGGTGRDTVTIDVNAETLQVTITADPPSGTKPLTVNLTSTVQGGTPPYTYDWQFPDGSRATTANVRKTFNAIGSYRISLTVTDFRSRQAFDDTTVTVTNRLPVVHITRPADGASFVEGEPIRFHGTATDPDGFPILARNTQWISNVSGSLGSDWNLTISTLPSGNHQITFEATDVHGGTGSASISINIGHIACNRITYPTANTVRSTLCLRGVTAGDRVRWDWYKWDGSQYTLYDQFEDVLNQNYAQIDVWSELVGQPPGTAGLVRIFYKGVEVPSFAADFQIP